MASLATDDFVGWFINRPTFMFSLHSDLITEYLYNGTYRLCRIVEHGLFAVIQLHLDDFLHALRPKYARHANKQVFITVFALQIHGRGDHALFIFHNRLDHADRRGGGRVIGAATHQADQFAATLA